ncbi:hypothetical protein ACFXP7_02115 [Microbacterium sp. P06]|uniref:hypothetical protein n=1 Tax=Microbacterium sp. P06 TaxID=3366949 RepID=UPI0037457EA9
MTGAPPRLVVHDVDQHGVAAYARDLVRAVIDAGSPDLAVLREAVPSVPPGTPLHLQFTDRLWASSPEQAAESVQRLGEQHPLSVTLHDVPQPSDGPRNLPRRLECYRAVAAVAAGVVCNSSHEAALLREHGVRSAAVGVIPLPVDVVPFRGDARPDSDGSIGVLGFFYPGKGHDEALRAAVDTSTTALSILGRASDGHAADLEAFVRGAAAEGVVVEVTGYLDDAELLRRCRLVGVPVVAHRHVSASGSLGSWIAAGRRPVATANRYVDEMASLRPGTIALTPPDALATAVAAAARNPASTWLQTAAVPHGRRDMAAAYLGWWKSLSW